MRTVEEARNVVLERASRLPAQVVELRCALGLILAEDVTADLDLPPFDKALVDGFAVRSADLAGGGLVPLHVVEEVTAGQWPSRPIASGEATAIMTGAPLPDGADAVVMWEQTERDGEGRVLVPGPVAQGQNRLTRGREMTKGEVILKRGERLTPPRIGLLASVGIARVHCVPWPRVAIMPTGDELVEIDQTPGPGQIRNSDMLQALVRSLGAQAWRRPIAPDHPERLRRALADALSSDETGKAHGAGPDVLVVSGGVSAGTRDLVPAALESLGIEPIFHKVRVRPGKPLWFGVGPPRGESPGVLVFGLPGNPVSGMVSVLLFLKPAIDALAGRTSTAPATATYPLAIAYRYRGDRPTYHPSTLIEREGRTCLQPLNWAGSADLRTVARADGFAVFPAGDVDYSEGDPVEFLALEGDSINVRP